MKENEILEFAAQDCKEYVRGFLGFESSIYKENITELIVSAKNRVFGDYGGGECQTSALRICPQIDFFTPSLMQR